ncbi:MAG: glycosyltransferase family 2 protein [Culicoidibacterales bacterium]
MQNAKTTWQYGGINGIYRKLYYVVGKPYRQYVKVQQKQDSERDFQSEITNLQVQPLISIVTPVYQVPLNLLTACAESILNQSYPNWQWCLVDDGSNNPQLTAALTELANRDNRINVKICETNQGISQASNQALEMVRGEYIALVDNDDTLAPHALLEIAKVLQDESVDWVYSDEDMLSPTGEQINPDFKPDWSPHTLLSRMYTNHLTVYRTELVLQVGGFRSEFDGCQDYDLALRISLEQPHVVHIPKILYHWRMAEQSIASSIATKPYIIERAKAALQQYFVARGYEVMIEQHHDLLMYDLTIAVKDNPKVTIIIPTRDHFDDVEQCIRSIQRYAGWDNYEIILVDNQSTPQQRQLFNQLAEEIVEMKILEANYEFNYAKLNNQAVAQSDGDYILLLNNDTIWTEEATLTRLLGIAQLPEVGAVGCRLLYPDQTIQHAGVILGYHEIAGHSGVGLAADAPGHYGRNVSLYNYSAMTAACLLVKRAQYDAVAGLDERFQVAYNDVDFCLKLMTNGWYNVHAGQVSMIHAESKSRGHDSLQSQRYQQECQLMEQKWQQLLHRDPYYNLNYSKRVGEMYKLKTR